MLLGKKKEHHLERVNGIIHRFISPKQDLFMAHKESSYSRPGSSNTNKSDLIRVSHISTPKKKCSKTVPSSFLTAFDFYKNLTIFLNNFSSIFSFVLLSSTFFISSCLVIAGSAGVFFDKFFINES